MRSATEAAQAAAESAAVIEATPQCSTQSKAKMFEAGWRVASRWANRNDLLADIGSPAYLKELEKANAK